MSLKQFLIEIEKKKTGKESDFVDSFLRRVEAAVASGFENRQS